MIKLPRKQEGIIHTLSLLVVVAAVGLIAFLLISSIGPFKGGLFNQLFKKPSSFAATDTITVSIDALSNIHPISPYIYGTAASSDPYQKTMGSTASRWGGNQVTRYNWEINDSNSGSDWGLCFQNYLGRNAFSNVFYTQGAAGISAKNSVNANNSLNMATLFTIPNLGWVAKDGNNSTCSTGVPANDGPAINSNGAITGYDPTANRNTTSVRSQIKKGSAFTQTPSTTDGVVYQDEFVNFLVSQFGMAQNGGVKFYAFDNEYDLWASTHRDIHPARVGYDELSSLFNQFSDAVKAVDSSAMVTGPVSWGWTNYWYSPLDAGTDNYGTHADRIAHGNVPLLQWFLRQAKVHEAQIGRRTLDVLDVHFYPQAGQYGNDDSTTMQALRLRSVRDLWDPTYTNESWMAGTEGGPKLQVIKRLQGWINSEYPGTNLGFSEWNFGDDGNINGGLTIADILGVYGRENVYSANYWTTPADQSPGYWAWRMYRNYDGNFSKFGDTSVGGITTVASDVDKISVYSSKDSVTGELKIMAINKQPTNDENTTFNIANFNPGGTAKVYRYSQVDTTKINQLSDIRGISANFNYNLSPYSITLFVLPPSNGGPTPTPIPSGTATPSPTPTSTPTPIPTPTPNSCPKGPLGDIDCNGKIDIFDYNTLVTNFGKVGTGIQGDIDKSGKIDIFDYNIIVTNFGR